MYPGPLGPVGRLKCADFGIALQRQRNFVEALKQALATARINLEPVLLA